MINKQISSLLFKNRTNDNSVTTDELSGSKQSPSEINNTKTSEYSNQTSDSSSNSKGSSLSISCQKAIQSAKEVLSKGKGLVTEFKKRQLWSINSIDNDTKSLHLLIMISEMQALEFIFRSYSKII